MSGIEDMPGEEARWCEIWLRTTSENSDSIEQTLRTFFLAEEIECQLGSLKFPERTVVLAKVSEADLELLISSFEFIAEFRRSKERAGYFVDVPNREQAEWVEHLRGRSHYEDTLVSVCILDTGANSG